MTSRLLTKTDLARLYDCYHPRSNQVDYQKLRKKVFDDKLLEAIGMTADDYKSIQLFSAQMSARIMVELNLTYDEIEQVRHPGPKNRSKKQ